MKISKYIDYIRDPEDTYEEYLEKAKKYDFRCVFANIDNRDIALAHLQGTDVIIASAIDFPEGIMGLAEKLTAFAQAAEAGFKEIDYVLNQKNIESKNYEAIHEEMKAIADFCREHGITDKAIVEMCKLDGDDQAKRRICEIAAQVRPAFLKTSTGRSASGAKTEDVRLIKEVLGDTVKIKAAGGIRDHLFAKELIDSGADALGASAGIAIVEGCLESESQKD